MKKVISALTAIVMVILMLSQPTVHAASAIKIYIDGKVLVTDQDPLLLDDYTFVPLRGIFEALNAQILWNQQTKTVTAKKNDTTIVLKIGSMNATINNRTVPLQAPARIVNNRTLVPVRFISESLGGEVMWDSKARKVIVTTAGVKQVAAVSSLNAAVISQNGDGRDLQISFTPPQDQSNVSSYRVLVVKTANASSMNLAKAQIVGEANYTTVSTSSKYPLLKLTSQSRDVDGALIGPNQVYNVFVLTVGNDSYALSSSSASLIVSRSSSTLPPTNVITSDTGDLGDGRDLSVSFTKAITDSNISGYRVMIVKSKDAATFRLASANAVPSSYYKTVSKTSSITLSTSFSTTSRDTSGELIKNGVAYTAFVLSLSDSNVASTNALSVASNSITLGSSPGIPTITTVTDVSNFGDGRDLQVNYIRAADEARINSYRIFVVREANYTSFNVTEANKVAADKYSSINKSGNSSYSQTLSSTMKDIQGYNLTVGVAYRVFVMGVTNHSSYSSVLSAASASITLGNSGVNSITNLSVSDVSDYNNGLDLRVAFTRASSESNINHYRILVVKDAYAGSFNLTSANAITNSNNYTIAAITGSNYSQVLSAGSRDVDGALIQNGLSYRVFVMSVGGGSSSGTNVLSSYSSAISLSNNSVAVVTNVNVSDVSDNNNGLDMRVDFTRASNESIINHYRILVVKDIYAGSFNLASATNVTNSNNYTIVPITGGNISQVLSAGSRDVDGALIQNGLSYRVFVLSVGGGSSSGTNVLSSYSSAITLSNTSVVAVTNVSVSDVSDNNNGLDLQVAFTKVVNESNINQYRIFVVKDSNASSFDLATANAITNSNYYTAVAKTGNNISQVLPSIAVDVNGLTIQNNVAYRAFVLSVAGNNTANALSVSSNSIVLAPTAPPVVPAPIVQGVTAQQTGVSDQILVNFIIPTDESGIGYYAVMIVPNSVGALTESMAINYHADGTYTSVGKSVSTTTLTGASKDVSGAPLVINVQYQVYVLSVANGTVANQSKLSLPSASVMLAP